ncbi:hypothetical protein [Bacillus tuaregi]|uniref:hypothetical protein n=1 Tax=Bacillus tuaregi TaxID=1816695 RepID=UPI0008F81C63|nr:hypothetical protein [Bacillus tuaregi]
MKKMRFGFLALLIMVIMAFASACGTTEEEAVDPGDENVTDVQDEQTTNDDSEDVEEPVVDEEPTETEGSGEGEDPVVGDEESTDALTVKGTFGGLADPHTFELQTDAAAEGVMAFQFYDEEIGEKLADMKDGQELTVIYKTNEHGQNLVESIE